jgi:hypothetical protein
MGVSVCVLCACVPASVCMFPIVHVDAAHAHSYALNLCEWHKGLAGGKPLLALQYTDAAFTQNSLNVWCTYACVYLCTHSFSPPARLPRRNSYSPLTGKPAARSLFGRTQRRIATIPTIRMSCRWVCVCIVVVLINMCCFVCYTQTLAFDQHARVMLLTAWGANQVRFPGTLPGCLNP